MTFVRCAVDVPLLAGPDELRQPMASIDANRKAFFIALALIFACASVFIFYGVYEQAKSAAIAKLDQQEMIYARQAARGIEGFRAVRLSHDCNGPRWKTMG